MVTIKVPLNISGFWVPHIGGSPETTGSLGASLTIEPPVFFRITRGNCPLVINGVCFEDYHPVVQELRRVGVSVKGLSPAPLGVGAAVSGSLALALAYAHLYLRGARFTINDVGMLAHRIEVETGGGLGDVICQVTGGGLVVRRKPGPPGVGEAIAVPTENVEVTLGVLARRLTTREMLNTYMSKFVDVGTKIYREFISRPSLSNFLKLSKDFSLLVGFVTRDDINAIDRAIEGLAGSVLGYFLKKSLLVVVHRPGVASEVRRAIERFCAFTLPPFKLARYGFTVSECG